MFRHTLMTTAAVLALTLPAAAQQADQPKTPPQGQQEQQATPSTGEQQPGTDMQGQSQEQPPAAAQGQTQGQPPAAAAQGAPEGQPTEQTAEKATPPAGMKFINEQAEAQFLANDEVIGKDVVNAKGEDVGTIADLVMDQDQKLVGVVLSVGGFLGIGDKWVAVPVDTIEFPAQDQPAKLLVEVSKDQLENAPDFVTKATKEAEQQADQAQQGMAPAAPTTAQ